MANTLTNLTPDLYTALDVISHELVGLIPAVSRDSNAERAAVNQTIRSYVAPASTAADITPAQIAPNTGDQTFTNKTLSISKSRAVPIRWNGEEQMAMNSGPDYSTMFGSQIEQAMRTLVNEVEADLASLYAEASRAVAPAGTTLFDSTGKLADFANVRKILVDNGAPLADMQCVIGSTEGAALRSLTSLTNVNEAGSNNLLRQGLLLEPISGFSVRESAAIEDHTAGTGASATTNAAGYAVGDTVLTLASAGTGTLLAGDVVTFAGDTNVYVIASGDADVSDGGTITLSEPGLRIAMSAATKAITVVDNGRRNMAFSRNAIHLATRVPARPEEGDAAKDIMIIQDPRSGLAFEIAMYAEYRQVHFEVSIAWGFAVMKPGHLALLID